jgi:hypothetical protein
VKYGGAAEQKNAKVDDRRKEVAMSSKAWFKAHRVLKNCNLLNDARDCVCPCTWLSHPDSELAAREKNMSKVIVLYKVMKKMGVQKSDIVVLIWLHDIIQAGLNIDNLMFDVTSADPPCKMHTIVGDHTTGSIQMHHSNNVNNPDFQNVEFALVICARTEENIQLAKTFGTLDNYSKSLQSPQTVWDNLNSIHNERIRLLKLKLSKEAFAKVWSGYRSHCTTSMSNYTANTIGSLFVLACFEGQLWSNFASIFRGEVLKRSPPQCQFKIPASHHNFCHMSLIPQSKLIEWSKRVVDGFWSCKDFGNRCLKYKKDIRVQGQMLEYVTNLYQEEYQSYTEMAEKYPFFIDKAWYESICSWCGDQVKSTLPPHAKTNISAKITALANLEKHVGEMV